MMHRSDGRAICGSNIKVVGNIFDKNFLELGAKFEVRPQCATIKEEECQNLFR